MGEHVFSKYEYERATTSRGIDTHKPTRVTEKAMQKVRETGKLDPAVDPAVDPIRRSLPRFNPTEDGRWVMTVGCPINIENVLDSTGSMGNNVDIAMAALPRFYELAAEMLPGCDPQLALGIFGDVVDDFVFCRPQFEMEAEKIVDYLTKMHPEGRGGDSAEDPQYAAFAAAYLTDAYTNRIGIKGYHFMVTDATAHQRISNDTLERVFGEKVWRELEKNGHAEISADGHVDMQDVYLELMKKYHAFAIIVDDEWEKDFWSLYYDKNVVTIPGTRHLPEVEAAIVGYTEGTLQPLKVLEYLEEHNVEDAEQIAEQITKRLDFAAQRKLEQASGMRIPKKGDIFAKKTDPQPSDEPAKEETQEEKPNWI